MAERGNLAGAVAAGFSLTRPFGPTSPATGEVKEVGRITLTDGEQAERDALAQRLVGATTGALELLHIYLGERLGLYRALADSGPLAADGLATAAGINKRYAREWLEQEAVAGILLVEPGDKSEEGRRYSLPPGHAEVLLNADSTSYLVAAARGVVAVGAVMPKIIEAFKSGGGVPYEAYGEDMRSSISSLNRPAFLNLLGVYWFPAISDVDRRLRAQPPARVADVGCGTGWSSIAIAAAYPQVKVDGFDLDKASIQDARRNAKARGVADRVKFEVRDAADPRLAGAYDLVTAFETIHDMSNPVGALRAMRALAKKSGAVVVMDEKVAEEFTAPGDDLERFLFGWSAVHCLPVGMAESPSAATGTMMRPSRLRQYAREAGFADIEILPVENDSWRFYRLV
jgi:2-polyprenyl-3-methyl-5-hydroxy-6-metoxy-1,4-benzoquinol methylase